MNKTRHCRRGLKYKKFAGSKNKHLVLTRPAPMMAIQLRDEFVFHNKSLSVWLGWQFVKRIEIR